MTRIPAPKAVPAHSRTLPYNGKVASQASVVFSFARFDREHELFNLGDDLTKPRPLPEEWFVSLLESLKEASSRTIPELKNPPFQLHPVKWDNANASKPADDSQLEYWQFRLTKSTGRVIGFIIPSDESLRVFYIVWLDAHHNLTDSEGYGTTTYYARPFSAYERLERICEYQRQQIEKLKSDLNAMEELLDEKA